MATVTKNSLSLMKVAFRRRSLYYRAMPNIVYLGQRREMLK